MTAVLDAPLLEETQTDDPDKLAHYFRKSELTESAVMGTPAKAICGYIKVIEKTGDGLPVCQTCDTLYKNFWRD